MTALSFEKIGTFSTEIWRVRLEYGVGSDGPGTLVLKSSVPGRGDRLGESFENEIRFYRELSHRVPARTPRFYAGETDPDAGRCLLLVEDLEVGRTNWLQGPTEEHARLAVATMARMHAAFWQRLEDLSWVPSFGDAELLESFDEAYERNWPAQRELFCEIVPAFGRVGDALRGRIVSSHEGLAEEPTLLHGDAHAENMPLVGTDVALLDWAGPQVGNAGVDLGFFIAMSFPAERRGGIERALVEHHAEVLAENGVRSRADPWLAYRRGVARRIACLVGITDSWPPGSTSSLRMIAHRCATAAVELHVEELV